jgi:hypothetical protein
MLEEMASKKVIAAPQNMSAILESQNGSFVLNVA